MNNSKKDFIAPVVVLSCICLVVSVLLALTYRVANPIIEANALASAVAARQQLLPAADSFSEVELGEAAQSEDGKAVVEEAYSADNGAGYVMTVVTKSFGGNLTMMVGIDGEGAITGVRVTEHADTPGVGTKDQDPAYLAQYTGLTELTSPGNVKKEAAALANGGTFDFISGASVSGQAIHSGVSAAINQFEVLGGAQ